MTRSLFAALFFLVSTLSLSLYAQAPYAFGYNIGGKSSHTCADAQCHHLNAAKSGNAVSHPFTRFYDAVYYRCEWTLDPNVAAISGNVTLYFKPNKLTDSIFVDLLAGMSADSVRYHGGQCAFTRGGNGFGAILPAQAPAGVLDSVTFYYHGTPSGGGFGSFTQDSHAGVPVLWTLSEPYGAMDWWPCKNTTDDKADSIDIYVTTPIAYRTASNGLMVTEEPLPGGTHRRTHWRHRHPITAYLVAISVTNYADYTEYAQIGSVALPVLNMVYPEELADWQANTYRVLDQLELYSNLFIPYPFLDEKYGHAQFSWGGGMEHQTMSFMVGYSFELQAHELAHQWFGDYITCGSFQDIWLNEGFATYLTGLSYENLESQWWPVWKDVTRNSVFNAPNGSVYVDDTLDTWRIFNGSLTYSKGAMVLHQLRWIMGDSAFFAGVQNYLQDPALAGGYAKTPDFQAHLEAAYGHSLQYFFDDWIYGKGWPIYDISFEQGDDFKVWVQVNQTQANPAVSFFEMPVPVQFSDGNGWDTTVVFNNMANGEWFSFDCPHSLQSGTLDPDIRLCAQGQVNLTFNAVEPLAGSRAVLAPNPATGSTTLIADAPIIAIAMTDLTGKNLLSLTGNGTERQSIDLTSMGKGVYLTNITTSRGTSVQKLVIR